MRITIISFLLLVHTVSFSQNIEYGIKYRLDQNYVFAEEKAGNSNTPSNKSTTDTLLASLTNSGSFSISSNPQYSVYFDFSDQLIYSYSSDSIFNINSLFSIVAYRVAEFENRKYLAELLNTAAGSETVMGNAAELEVIFGVEDSENSVRNEIIKKNANDTTSYEYINSVFCKVHYSTHPLAKEYQKSMEHFLVYSMTLHPMVKEDILQTGLIPDYIFVNYSDIGQNISLTHTLLDCGVRVSNNVKTSLNEKALRSINADEMNGLVDSVFYDRLYNKYSIPDSNAVYRTADKLCSEGKYLSALLCVFEYVLSTGNESISHIKPIVIHQDDADLSAFIAAMNPARNEEEAFRRVADFNALIAKDLEYAHILNIYAANVISVYDTEQSIEYFYKALSLSPEITNAWYDLGRTYAGMYDYITAWKCFEIVFRSGTPQSNKSDVQKLKKKLKLQHPEYF